jgi:hypothetical protein
MNYNPAAELLARRQLNQRIRRSMANDPEIQRLVERHDKDADHAERMLEKWGVLPNLLPWIQRMGAGR